jgi:hypothetical protein
MSIRSAVAVIAAALVVGACSGAHVVFLQSEYAQSTYDFNNFSLYHAGRDTRVEIHGNPFDIDPAVFARAVTDRMQGANNGRRTNFTTTPGNSAEKNLRVVMVFNAAKGTYDLCDGKPIKTKPSKDRLRLAAAWCFADRQDSLVEASVGPAASISDQRFRDLVQQTVLNLFPTHMDYILIRDRDKRGS